MRDPARAKCEMATLAESSRRTPDAKQETHEILMDYAKRFKQGNTGDFGHARVVYNHKYLQEAVKTLQY